MGLSVFVKIETAAGYVERLAEYKLLRRDYDTHVLHEADVEAGNKSVALSMGPVKTAQLVYIETDKPITVARNNSVQRDSVDSLYFMVGCEITALNVVAPDGAHLKVFVAGLA